MANKAVPKEQPAEAPADVNPQQKEGQGGNAGAREQASLKAAFNSPKRKGRGAKATGKTKAKRRPNWERQIEENYAEDDGDEANTGADIGFNVDTGFRRKVQEEPGTGGDDGEDPTQGQKRAAIMGYLEMEIVPRKDRCGLPG